MSLTDEARISKVVMQRMQKYLCALNDLHKKGTASVSSREIAEMVGVKSGLVRKDLCQFGGFGRPSVGYNIQYLQKKLKEILDLNAERKIIWVGSRQLSDEPAIFERLSVMNYRIAAVFDVIDGNSVKEVNGIEVMPIDAVANFLESNEIDTAVIAIAGAHTDVIAKLLIENGINRILNLTPTILRPQKGVEIRNFDIAGELMLVSFSD